MGKIMAKSADPTRLSLVSENGRLDPPVSLGEAGRVLWRKIQAEYAIDDIGGRALLEQICGAADRIETIRAAVAEDGPVIRSRKGGVRVHPCLQAEIQNRALIMRGLEKLGITVEPIKPHGHPTKPTGWIPPELR
jgi:hypothetical protein